MIVNELIGRLKTAEAGSRELDGEIFRAVNPDGDPVDFVTVIPPPYTYDMATALTLMPRDTQFWCLCSNLANRTYSASAFNEKSKVEVQNIRQPALALCVAALLLSRKEEVT